MNKKIISGIVALSMVASMGMFASAQLLGDVTNDSAIDIEDAVTIISRINGDTQLDDISELAADVNEDGVVDIEDAVQIIGFINGDMSIEDKEVTIEEDSKAEDESSKAEDESSKAEDESSKAEDESSKAEDESSKAEDESSKAEDDSSTAEDTNGDLTYDAIDQVTDGEFKISGEGTVNYASYNGAKVSGTVEQKDGITHIVVTLGDTPIEECYTVNGKTYIKDSVDEYAEGTSKFGKLATGEYNKLFEDHKGDLDYQEGDGTSETFDFTFFDSIIAKAEVTVSVTITYEDGVPTKVVAVDKDGNTVFESSSVTFSDTTDDIVLPKDIQDMIKA